MKSFIRQFDIFGTSVNWNVKKQVQTRSLFGSFLTASFFGILGYISWISGNDMIYKSSPNVRIENLAFPSRPILNLNADTFPVAITCQDYSQKSFLDPRFFRIEAYHYTVYNANSTTIPRKLELENCEASHFPNFDSDYLTKSGMFNYLCIKNQDVNLGGYWDDLNIQYLAITASICVNRTSEDNCAPTEDITNLLNTNPTSITLAIYVQNWIINTLNYEKPLSSFMLALYKNMFLGKNKLYTVSIREDEISTDDDIIFNELTTQKAVTYDSADYDDSPGNFYTPLVEIDILVANHKLVYHRRYLKVLDVFANLGGLSKFFFTVCYVLVYHVSQMQINLMLLNELYEYNLGQSHKSNTKHNSLNSNSAQIIRASNFVNNNTQLSASNRKSIADELSEINPKKLKLKFGAADYFFLVPGFSRCTKEIAKLKWGLYEKTKSQLTERLDVSHLLLKIQEFSKLKEVILSKEQLVIFNYIAKEQLGTSVITDKKDEEIIIGQPKIPDQLRTAERFLNSSDNSGQPTGIDLKLITLLDAKMMKKDFK